MIQISKQKLIYPMDFINITQGSNGEFSHKGIYAIDLAGKDSGSDPVYAQGNGVVTKITDKSVTVRYPNVVGQSGTVYKYCDVQYYHNTADKDIKVGQALKRGQVFMHEGKKGNATGNHIHVTVIGTLFDGRIMKLMPERMFTIMPSVHKKIKNKSAEPIRYF